MLKNLLTSILSLLLTFGLSAQVVLENFEGGSGITWTAFDGTYDGIVDNPENMGLNMSANVGSYTKSGAHAFSLFLGETSAPLDLSTNNRFTIQIYSAVATQILLKLEGVGEAIEMTKNIAITNRWVEYSFDFSAAANFTTINKIILFFDPGVETSADTYLFDNLVANPAGPCAGTVPNPQIIDDFECQRNATYAVPGVDDIEMIANPDPSGINTSTGVGRYTDRDGAFHAMVIDYNNAIDLSVNNYVCIKVWAPVTGNLLFKLEGGISPPNEQGVQITETNTWVQVCANFSSQAAANHKKLVFFFNAGENGDGDIYYIDDITRTPVPAPGPLEDFEDGANLSWGPLNGNTGLHGTFSGPVANPAPNDVNDSPFVGCYTRGTSLFSTLTALLPDGIDLSDNPQLNLHVWAPAGATTVTLQLQSPTEGARSVDADITATQEWIELNFDFSAFSTISDFERVNILFGPGVAGATVWYFDNLAQGGSTVDPCADVTPIPTILDDFECQRNGTYGVGADRLAVINNPDVSLGNTSLKVGEYTDPNDPWSALVIDNGATPIDLSIFSQFSIRVWSPGIVPMLFKLEGGSDPAVEIFTDVTATNTWVRYQIDFSEFVGTNHTRLAIFINAGQEPGSEIKYYIDDLEWRRAPYRACMADYESPAFTIDNWFYFANGEFDGPGNFTIANNPAPDGVNNSATVGVFRESTMGAVFAGMFSDPGAPIALPNDNKTVRMKVWMDHAAPVVLKLEAGNDGAPATGDIFGQYTTPNQWQELVFDYSAVVPDDATYNRITLIMDIDAIPTETKTYYFDDIAIADEFCGVVGTFEPRAQVASLQIWPNPAGDWLQVSNPEGKAHTFVVHNTMGQPVRVENFVGGGDTLQLDLTGLPAGVYMMAALDANGLLIANARFSRM